MMKAILCEPKRKAVVVEFESEDEMRREVGDPCRASYMPYGDDAVMLRKRVWDNKEGISRIIITHKFRHQEVIRGKFLICGSLNYKEVLCGLTEEQIEKYMRIFRNPPGLG